MSGTTESWPTAHLRRVVALSAAGRTPGQIAQELNDTGVPVPRASGHPATWPDRGVVGGAVPTVESDGADGIAVVLTAETFPASRDGHCLATEPGNPGRWTAEAVSQVLAAPEASSTNNFSAARAKLGSDSSTTLSVD